MFSSAQQAHKQDDDTVSRIWLLHLVPTVKHGRWICASLLFVTIAGLIALQRYQDPADVRSLNWPIAMFFCVVIAYIVPVFHFITEHTERAFDELTPHLKLDGASIKQHRRDFSYRSTQWQWALLAFSTSLWLIQSWLLLGSPTAALQALFASPTQFINAILPLLVWTTMTTAIGNLIHNARAFRRLTPVIDVDVLNTGILTPVGRMAVSSTLMVIGAQASLSIMWLGGATNPWTTIPGLLTTSTALVYLFIAPVWPLHKAIKRAKAKEIEHVQISINAYKLSPAQDYANIAPLLIYRREIGQISDWPMDINVITRLGLYLIIVPLTWVGAALIENAVDLFIG
jgi:hypothetical protein